MCVCTEVPLCILQDLLAKMAASEDPSVIVRLHYTLQDLATRVSRRRDSTGWLDGYFGCIVMSFYYSEKIVVDT